MKRLVSAPTVKFHRIAKVNKMGNVFRCNKCLELSTFRVFQANGVNRIACVICLNSVRYNKSKSIQDQGITINRNLNLKEVFTRYVLRFKTYLLGNHIYGPFKRRRKK